MVSDDNKKGTGSDSSSNVVSRFADSIFRGTNVHENEIAPRVLVPSKYKRLTSLFPWGRVSKVHLNEAKERYITLSRLVEHYKKIYNDITES